MPGANGHKHTLEFEHPPRRVVSLVPSVTESLIMLGFGSSLVGRTDYCTQPVGQVEHLPTVGGTKNPRVDDILALRPDLVLANREENTRETIEALRTHKLQVWVMFPRTVRESIDDLWRLVGVYRSKEAAVRLETLEIAFEWAQSAAPLKTPTRVFCPIWQGESDQGTPWWMTFNRDTYSHNLLQLVGGANVFAGRERRYPLAADLGKQDPEPAGDRDTRYPRVTLEEIRQAAPELVFLPSEPFAFDENHRTQLLELLADIPAGKAERIYLVDGSLLTWHGVRIARALQVFPEFFM